MITTCKKCLMKAYQLSGGSTVGILMMQEAIASNAIEHDVSYEEMEERIFQHSTHSDIDHINADSP